MVITNITRVGSYMTETPETHNYQFQRIDWGENTASF